MRAVIRNCVAFNFDAIIITSKSLPKYTATIAKTSSGCLEKIKIIKTENLSQTLKNLKNKNFWVYSLDVYAENSIQDLSPSNRNILILGSEGKGIRPLVNKQSDFKFKIDIHKNAESLNLSVACGISCFIMSSKNNK